jgi:two-component system NtrC family sensor kinase
LMMAKQLNFKDNLEKSYHVLAKVDSAKGNYKQAYDHYKSYILYRDSIFNEETTKKSLQTQMQYDFDKKESIAKAVQDKKDADAKRIKNQQYFVMASLGVLVLAVVIIAFIQFRNNKQKQKANLLLERQKEKVEITLLELKSTQSQLIQSEKMASLGELTAGIAHEIQNPLNFVNNFSEVNKELIEELRGERQKAEGERNTVLENEILTDIEANEEKINHHGKRADAIVKGMLQHSRSSVGVKELTDINALADEYLRLSYHGLRAKDNSFNATMKTDFDESIGKINIIPQDIGRVLLNLYTNAFYAVAEKQKLLSKEMTSFQKMSSLYEPTITVSTKKSVNQVSINVSDNGNGIPKKIVDKIFQPFFTTKPTGQGTGLGLSLSYDIIKAHGGEIKVETKEGESTTFIIHLAV